MIPYKLPKTGAVEQELWRTGQRLDPGELFSLGVSHSFERETTLGLLREEGRIQDAEKEAGTFDPLFGQFESDRAALGLPTGHAHAMSEDAYKASEWYRKRPDGTAAIDYAPNMTPQRARILAEVYDRRQHEKQLLQQNGDTFGRQALLFGASFLAQLPDPINFVPVMGAAGKGASVGTKVLRGAAEGAVSTALADAVLFPVANARGEDFGFFDLAMDITFGAVIGGGLAGIGGALAQRRERRTNAEFDELQKGLAETFQETGLDVDAAGRIAKQTVADLKGSVDGLERARALRTTIGGGDRANMGAMMDLAAKAVTDNEPVDAGAWRTLLGMRSDWTPENYLNTAALVESGERPSWGKLTAAEMLPEAERFYTESLAGKTVTVQGREVAFRGSKNGWGKLHGKTPDPDKLKLLPYIDKILESSEWVYSEPARRDVQAGEGMKVHTLLALVEHDGKRLEVRSVVREHHTGKLFYDFLNETELAQRKTPPESQGPSAGGPARGGEKNGNGGSSGPQRQTGDRTGDDPVFQESFNEADITLHAEGDDVNLEIRDVTPDMRPVPAQPVYRAPELLQGPDAELAAMGIDPKTGQSFDELEALRLAEEGKADAGDMAALEAARLEHERVDTREDIALSLVPCILGGL